MAQVKRFAIALVILLVIDGVWLTLMSSFYAVEYGSLAKENMNLLAGLGAWLLIALGISVLAVPRAKGSLRRGLFYGAVFGLVVYGVYDITNLAVVEAWSCLMTVVDMIWGTVLCSITTALVIKAEDVLNR